MEQTSIAVLLPSEFTDEVERFIAENPKNALVEKQSQGREAAADLGFEPVTIAVTAWVLKFAAGAASSLASKLLVDRIWKRLQSKSSDRLTEVQIAFPSGLVVTVRGEGGMTAEQLQKLITENVR
jgi:hypothetical protein